MKPWMMLSYSELTPQRPPVETDDVHFTESLATTVIAEFSAPGDVVLDPFAGFGGTPYAASRMGRLAVAVELIQERASYARQRTTGAADVITGDARELASLVTGPADLCLTSPPYMTAAGHPQNPLTGFMTRDGDYQTYLSEIDGVLADVASLLRPGGYAVINVANIVSAGVITPAGLGRRPCVSRHLILRREILMCWDQNPPGLSGDYCLAFQKVA
jgi:DNA modification methylase